MLLCVDIGNTRTKAGVFRGRRLLHVSADLKFDVPAFKAWLKKHKVASVIYSSVRADASGFEQWLPASVKRLMLTPRLRMNFNIRYASPNTLGTDRIANLAGASSLFPNRNVLLVSAGTCITYDLLHAGGHFYGGSISPGISMRLQAAHVFTGRLPAVEKKNIAALFGTDTTSALQTGALNGARFELAGYLEAARQKVADPVVILTGGDARLLKGSASVWGDCRIFVRPFLSLRGLNELARLNEDAFYS